MLTRYTPNLADGYNRIHGLGLTAAYQRLAGRAADFRGTLKKIEEYAGGPRADSQPKLAAKALLINERTAAAQDILTRFEQFQEAAELLISQGALHRWAGALRARGESRKGPGLLQPCLSYFAATPRRRPEGRPRLAGNARHGHGRIDRCQLARSPNRSGGEAGPAQQAERRLLDRLDRNDGSYLSGCFAALFPGLGSRAETVWRLLRHRYPKDTAAETLKRLQQVEERRLPADELAALLRTAPDPAWVPQAWMPAAFEHLAFVVNRFERTDLAAALLKDPGWEKASTSAG